MAAVVEQGIHPFSIADLTHLALLVRNLPVCGALTPTLALLVATNVFIAGALLNEDTLTVLLVVRPAANVGIAV